MNCSTCGSIAISNAKFCDNCGSRLDVTPSSVEAQSPLVVSDADLPASDLSGATQTFAPAAPQDVELRSGPTVADRARPDGSLQQVEVPEPFAVHRGDCPRATLRFANRADYGRIHVFAQSELKLGRVPELNDVVLWRVPRSADNDAASAKIRKRREPVHRGQENGTVPNR